jgi:hypothetical protein
MGEGGGGQPRTHTHRIPSRKQSCQDVSESLFIIDLVYKIRILFPIELVSLIPSCWKSFPLPTGQPTCLIPYSMSFWCGLTTYPCLHVSAYSSEFAEVQVTTNCQALPTNSRPLISVLPQCCNCIRNTTNCAVFLRWSCFLYTEWSTISSPLKFNLLLQRNKDVLHHLVCNNIASQIALWINKCYKYRNISCELYGQF